MIRINLLPIELRYPERTPLGKMLLIILGAIFVVASVILLFSVQVIWLPNVRSQRADKQDDKARKEERAQEYNDLQAEISAYENRSKAISQITAERVIWARKLDQLCDLILPDIWFDGMKLESPRIIAKGRPQEGPTLTLDCLVVGDDETRIADFLRTLKQDDPDAEDFFDDFLHIDRFGWTPKEFRDFKERMAISFRLALHMKPLGKASSPEKTSNKAR